MVFLMTDQIVRERPDTHEMYVVHRVFRRETALLPRLVRNVRAGDTERARFVAAHYRDYALGLHHHHTAEDLLIWPLLLARVDLEAELVLRMEQQHEVVAAGLEAVAALLPEIDLADEAAAEARFRALADELGLKAGNLFMPIRVAATGRTQSPGLFGTLRVIGKERVQERVAAALEALRALEASPASA